MSLAYLISQYPGSTHTFIRREVEAIRRRGFDLQTFSVRRPLPAELQADEDRVAFKKTFYILGTSAPRFIGRHLEALLTKPGAYLSTFRVAMSHRVPGAKALLWAFFHFAEAILLASELRRRGITHLHNHFANAGATVGLLAARYLRISWSLTLHGISETDYPAGLLLGRKIEQAQFVACVSWFGRAQAMRVTPPEHWHKMFITRCGLDLTAVPLAKAREGSRLRIICVGRLSPEKGHIGLLEAFSTLGSDQAELVLVGDGPELPLVEECVRTLRLEEKVRFKGRLDEKNTLREIASADLLVLPSFMEGLPIVLMEAMAAGVPVLGPRVAGVPELIAEGEEGLLFRPSDWADLAEKMRRLISDEELRRRCAAAGRRKIEQEFQIDAAVEPLAQKFMSLHTQGNS